MRMSSCATHVVQRRLAAQVYETRVGPRFDERLGAPYVVVDSHPMQRRHLGLGLRIHVGSLSNEMVDAAEVTWLGLGLGLQLRLEA